VLEDDLSSKISMKAQMAGRCSKMLHGSGMAEVLALRFALRAAAAHPPPGIRAGAQYQASGISGIWRQ